MKTILMAAAGLMAISAQSAVAADLPVKAVPIVPIEAFNWTGFYIGINGGGKWISPHNKNSTVFSGAAPGLAAAAIPITFESNSGTIGGQIGYNWQFSTHLMVGVEADFNWQDFNNTFTLRNPLPPPFIGLPIAAPNAPDFFTQRMDWQSSIRVRGAWVAGPGMIYLTGGAAFAEVAVSATFPQFQAGPGAPIFPASAGSSTKTRVGWTAGIGGEFAINKNWSLGAEYRYTDYGFSDYSVGTLAGVVNPAGGFFFVPITVRNFLSTQEILAKLNYRFNWAAPLVASY